MTAYLTVFNVLFWTHGLSIMDRKGETGGGWKKIFNPSVIGILLGVLCFVARVRLPEVLLSPITLIGNMNTPLAMMIAGISLAQGDIRHSLKNKRLYLLTLTRLGGLSPDGAADPVAPAPGVHHGLHHLCGHCLPHGGGHHPVRPAV